MKKRKTEAVVLDGGLYPKIVKRRGEAAAGGIAPLSLTLKRTTTSDGGDEKEQRNPGEAGMMMKGRTTTGEESGLGVGKTVGGVEGWSRVGLFSRLSFAAVLNLQMGALLPAALVMRKNGCSSYKNTKQYKTSRL